MWGGTVRSQPRHGSVEAEQGVDALYREVGAERKDVRVRDAGNK
jgi:hypothetical protein